MENPTAIRRQSRTIIKRFLDRVRVRNNAHDLIQKSLHNTSANDCTIMGVPISELPEIYHYHILSGGVCYTYDIRELFQHLRTGYETAKCPYTNKAFTRYQKYLIVREYYHRKILSGFEALILDSVSHLDYATCSARVNSLLDDYNRFNIENVSNTCLFNVLTEIIKYDAIRCSARYISQAHHHYINGNMRNYRTCVYMFLISIIEEAADCYVAALQIQQRITYCQWMYPSSDPIRHQMPSVSLRVITMSDQSIYSDDEPPYIRRRTYSIDTEVSSDEEPAIRPIPTP